MLNFPVYSRSEFFTLCAFHKVTLVVLLVIEKHCTKIAWELKENLNTHNLTTNGKYFRRDTA